MFTFNNEYLFKFMVSLVRDEGNRIVSLGLATEDGLKKMVEPALHDAIKKVSGDLENPSIVIDTLAILHRKLNSISLPGDFEKVSSPIEQQLREAIGLEIAHPEEVTQEVDVIETETSVLESEEDNENINVICAFLESTSYKLGNKGNHDAAYLIERTIRKIKGF